MPSSAALRSPCRRAAQPLERLECLFAPAKERVGPARPEAERHQPVRQLGMGAVLSQQFALLFGVRPPERLLALTEALHVTDALRERPAPPEEDLEEELAP